MAAYILRPGKKPGIALCTWCGDEVLCRAELLLLMDRAKQDRPDDQMI